MSQSSLLVPLSEEGEGPPLFFVPSAGSTPLSLVKLARALRPKRPVYSFVFAGMDEGQEAHTSVEEMASAYLTEIRAVENSGPYLVAGHCFGASVALEIVAKLEALGEKVAVLALLESFAPLGKTESAGGSAVSMEDPSSVYGKELKKLLGTVIAYVGQQLARLPPKQAERFGRITHQHLAMGESYDEAVVDAPIVMLRTETHDEAVYESWRHFTRGRFSEFVVPGGTFTMLSPPHVAVVGEALGGALRAG